MKILVINGINLDKLGSRDKTNYGSLTLDQINSLIKKEFNELDFTFFQSNLEHELVNKINEASNYDGIIINPGGFTHTSVAIRDALENIKIPKIEVHLSNLASREEFRNILLTTSKCDGYISGFKEISFLSAVYTLTKIIQKN
ncbi:MAG: 3-dehydroquinate dehydratase [Ignavibacteriales bacterium]|nr:3-dehydroquinate dehydratase [Ignavibacteriales bacterium]